MYKLYNPDSSPHPGLVWRLLLLFLALLTLQSVALLRSGGLPLRSTLPIQAAGHQAETPRRLAELADHPQARVVLTRANNRGGEDVAKRGVLWRIGGLRGMSGHYASKTKQMIFWVFLQFMGWFSAPPKTPRHIFRGWKDQA